VERTLLGAEVVMNAGFASWTPFAARGAIALLFGFAALVWSQMTLVSLVLLFGTYALLDGVATLLASPHHGRERIWVLLLEGIAGIGLGLAILRWARLAPELLVLLIAVWAMVTGFLELFAAIRLRREIHGDVLLGVCGLSSVALGFAIVFWPTTAVGGLLALLGCYAVVFGVSMLLQAHHLRPPRPPEGGADHRWGRSHRAA
jgi:uncharacterized membrane protein HdeD (DUF308 family)